MYLFVLSCVALSCLSACLFCRAGVDCLLLMTLLFGCAFVCVFCLGCLCSFECLFACFVMVFLFA